MSAIGPDVPFNVRTPLLDHDERLKRLEMPGRPMTGLYVFETETTAAQLPAAGSYTNAVVWLRALKTIAVSNGTSWIRQDTQGALA